MPLISPQLAFSSSRYTFLKRASSSCLGVVAQVVGKHASNNARLFFNLAWALPTWCWRWQRATLPLVASPDGSWRCQLAAQVGNLQCFISLLLGLEFPSDLSFHSSPHYGLLYIVGKLLMSASQRNWNHANWILVVQDIHP